MPGQRPHDGGPRALPGRVEHDDGRAADARRDQLGGHGGLLHLEAGQPGTVVARVGAGADVALDGEHGSRRPDRGGQRDREQPGARVEVDGRGAAAGQVAHGGEDRIEQRLGRADVRLPEHAGGHPIGAAAHRGMNGTGRSSDLAPHDEADVEVG